MLILGAQYASKGTVSDVTLTHLIPVLADAAHGAIHALSDDLTPPKMPWAPAPLSTTP